MKTFAWQNGLLKKADALCEIFPSLIRERWRTRLISNAEKIAAFRGVEAVTEEIFWEAVYEVFPGGYEPLILKVKDPAQLKRDMVASRSQEDMAPGTEPVRMTRWGSPADSEPADGTGKKICAVCSSARKNGNTDVVIDQVLQACIDRGADVEKVYLSDLAIKPCTGCRACRKGDVKTICTIRDDMTSLMYPKLYGMDGLVLGFPIYTARENGIMANFMDRWDCFANPFLSRKMPDSKKALIVCSWMWPNTTAYDNVVEQMIILLRLHKVTTTDVLVISGTRGKHHGRGVVKNHPELLNQAYLTGTQFLGGLSETV